MTRPDKFYRMHVRSRRNRRRELILEVGTWAAFVVCVVAWAVLFWLAS